MNTIIRKINHAFNYLIHDREQLINSLLSSFFTWLPDKMYLRLKFRFSLGYWPNFKNPQSFNEKLNWLKLYNRKPEYTQMVDKFAVKDYVANKIGAEYVIPTLGVWDKPENIDWDILPSQFVLKTTHGGGNSGVVICRNRESFNRLSAVKKLNMSLKQDIYKKLKEWPYKNVPRRIIAEKFIEDENSPGDLPDYKFFCFDGYVHSVMLCLDRHLGDTKFYFFDKDWNLLRLNIRGKEAPKDFTLPKPQNIEKMFEIASILSKGHKFLRVDLYNSDGKIYFGELTFFPDSGFDANITKEADNIFGSLLKL